MESWAHSTSPHAVSCESRSALQYADLYRVSKCCRKLSIEQLNRYGILQYTLKRKSGYSTCNL